jgi:hypothetical protein
MLRDTAALGWIFGAMERVRVSIVFLHQTRRIGLLLICWRRRLEETDAARVGDDGGGDGRASGSYAEVRTAWMSRGRTTTAWEDGEGWRGTLDRRCGLDHRRIGLDIEPGSAR